MVVEQNVFKVSRQLIIRLMAPNYHLMLAKWQQSILVHEKTISLLTLSSSVDKYVFEFIQSKVKRYTSPSYSRQ